MVEICAEDGDAPLIGDGIMTRLVLQRPEGRCCWWCWWRMVEGEVERGLLGEMKC